MANTNRHFPSFLLRTLNQPLINVSPYIRPYIRIYLVSAFNVCWECPVSNLCPWVCLTWRDFITWGNKLGTRAKHTHQAPKQSKLEHNLNFIKGRAIFWTPPNSSSHNTITFSIKLIVCGNLSFFGKIFHSLWKKLGGAFDASTW